MLQDIPPNEFASFKDVMHIHERGDCIITEGDLNNKAVFLLRKGEVEIYKNSKDGRKSISKIKALNFFGEMGLLSDKPRSATVEVCSQRALVYKIEQPSLHAILANPTWGGKLLSRLATDLEQRNQQLVKYQESARMIAVDLEEMVGKYSKLKRDHDHLKSGAVEIFSALSGLYKHIGFSAIINTRDWSYLIALDKTVKKLLKSRLPEIQQELIPAGPEKWKQLYQEGILPEILYSSMQHEEE